MRHTLKLACLAVITIGSLCGQTTVWLRSGTPNISRVRSTSGTGVSPMQITTWENHGLTGGEDITFAYICGPTVLNNQRFKVKSSPAPTETTFYISYPN